MYHRACFLTFNHYTQAFALLDRADQCAVWTFMSFIVGGKGASDVINFSSPISSQFAGEIG
eukprot:m.341598 g.341598  ORF g.341598 m.341598 type:complete len:61 (+) comp16113_c0_seq13:2461-2643(+)